MDDDAFVPSGLSDDPTTNGFAEQLDLHEATLTAVYMHQHNLDVQLSTHVATNRLLDARSMLDTEDRQDIMLDTDESIAYHDDDYCMLSTSNVIHVDDEDDSLQFTDRLRGQHTADEIMSLNLLQLLRAIGAPNYAYRSVMDIYADAVSSKVVFSTSTFRQRGTAIKHLSLIHI